MKANWNLDPVKEALAAKSLRESIVASYGEDDELVLDTIEGETTFFEIIDRLLLRRAEALGMAEGVGLAIEALKDRQDRFSRRADVDRALIEQALVVADLPKVERPAATLSLSKRAPSLQITEESQIPTRFWRVGDPKLDKKALLEALKADTAIPGACLSNAAPSLTIRVR